MWSLVIDETIVDKEYARDSEKERMLSYTEAIREAVEQSMDIDKNIYAMGQGINDKSAYWGITTGLYKKYTEKRVFDIPLAENGMAGVATGSALAGLRPIYFHNRPDFLFLEFDQLINHAMKYPYMSGGQCSVPMVIWATTGKGWGSAAQHSQSLQSFFMHVPGCKVIMPTTPYDAKGLMISSIIDNNPVIILEHRSLLNQRGFVPNEMYKIEIGKGVVRREGTDITIVGISAMIKEAIAAADRLEQEGIRAEVIDLRSIKPWDEELVIRSVEKTGRLIIVDTSWRKGGVSAEIAATIYEQLWGKLKCEISRIGNLDIPTPASPSLEDAFYCCEEDIYQQAVYITAREQ